MKHLHLPAFILFTLLLATAASSAPAASAAAAATTAPAASTATAVTPTTSADAPTGAFTEYAGNPVLAPGAAGSWDDAFTTAVSVVYDGVYHMWYTGSRASGSDQIGYATSPDGWHWTRQGAGPVLRPGTPGKWDDGDVSEPAVVKDGSRWLMWYDGSKSGQGYAGIGLATSTDGINWVKSTHNPVLTGSPGWENSTLYRPTVLLRDGVYHMWYSSYGSAIGYAHSTDGESWTKSAANPVLKPGAAGAWDSSFVGAPSVLFYRGQYHMWYQSKTSTTDSSFGHASAADPEHWTKDAAPVLQTGPFGSWDAYGIAYPSVLYSQGKFRMWFHGKDSSRINTPLRVGYADADAGGAPTGRRVHLPFVYAPPLLPPAPPHLNAIDNPSAATTYDVSWSIVQAATAYELSENGAVVYTGPAASYQVSGKAKGRYCYAVTAKNAAGTSASSNTECTDVSDVPAFTPRDGDWVSANGAQWFTVKGDRLVNAGIRVEVSGCGTASIQIYPSGATIDPDTKHYAWTGTFYGDGVFTSATTATGSMGLTVYYLPGCGYVTGGPYAATYTWQNAAPGNAALPAVVVSPAD